MIRVSQSIVNRVTTTYGSFFEGLSRLPAAKCAMDVLDERKVHHQIRLLCDTIHMDPKELRGQKVLEIGSGFGIFVSVSRNEYGCESYGLEPAAVGFNSSYEISKDILREYGIDPTVIQNAPGERIPFADQSMDIVFSSTVLEHVQNPQKVLTEGIRVLKPGGYLQFVFPNYGSFYEGHYAIPWIPYLNKTLGKAWVRLWRRDPGFVDTLNHINYFQVRKWMKGIPNTELITFGEEIFKRRMRELDVPDWAGLAKIRKVLTVVQRLGLISAATRFLVMIKSFEPFILTLRKSQDGQQN